MEPDTRGYKSPWALGLLSWVIGLLLLGGPNLHAQENKKIAPGLVESSVVQGQKFSLVYRLPGQLSTASFTWLGPIDFMQANGPVEFRPVLSDGFGEGAELSTDMVIPFKALSAGYQLVPALRITAGTSSLDTEEMLLPIAVPGNPLAVPPVLTWAIPDQDLYEGQSILVTLMMSKTKTLLIPRAIEHPPITGGIFDEVEGSARSSTESLAGENLLNMPLATFMLTPSQAGEITLPQTLVRFKDFDVRLDARILKVQALSGALTTFGAIGEFTSSLTFDTDTFYENEVFTAIVRIDGRGNLNFLKMPTLVAPGFQVQGIQSVSNYEPGVEGYRGYREERYRLLAAKSGAHSLVLGSFDFFEPASRTSSWIEGRTVNVNILPARISKLPKTMALVMPQAPLKDKLGRNGLALWIALILTIILSMAIFLKGRISDRVLIPALIVCVIVCVLGSAFQILMQINADQEVSTLFAPEREAPGLDELTQRLAHDRGSPLLWYGLAVRHYENGNKSAALFALGQILALRYSEEIAELRHNLQLEMAIDPEISKRPWYLDPLLVYLGLILVLVAAILLKRSLFLPALAILSFAFLIGAVHALGTFNYGGDQALIRDSGAPLRKIPELSSRPWIELTPGAKVKIIAHFDSYALVETTYNVKGWVFTRDLYVFNQEIPDS